MSENWRSFVVVAPAPQSPADTIGLVKSTMPATSVLLSREPLQSFARRNVRRQVVANYPLFSEYRLRWEWELTSNLDPLRIALASLGDNRSTPSLFRFGNPAYPIRRDFFTGGEDGQQISLLDAACASLTLAVEPRKALTAATYWPGWQTGLVHAESATPVPASTLASPADCAIRIGGESLPVFRMGLEISRDIRPAGYNGDRVATAWAGDAAVDVVGKVALRASKAWLDAALTSTLEDDIEISIDGPEEITLTLPKAIFQAASKTVVGTGTWEYEVEFVAGADPDCLSIAIG